jgi:transcriptional regulator with XRE-family HTH domain
MWPAHRILADGPAGPSDASRKLLLVAVRRTTRPFVEELPDILKERNLSVRALARMVNVGDDHLSRVLRGARAKKPTADLARRVAVALDLPEDYFPEVRLDYVVQELTHQPQVLDRVYDQLRRAKGQKPARRRTRR